MTLMETQQELSDIAIAIEKLNIKLKLATNRLEQMFGSGSVSRRAVAVEPAPRRGNGRRNLPPGEAKRRRIEGLKRYHEQRRRAAQPAQPAGQQPMQIADVL